MTENIPRYGKSRLKRNQRSSQPPNVVVNDRDIQVIAATAKYRYLTTGQIKELLFGDCSVQSCRLRLLKLYQNGYLNRLRPELGLLHGSSEAVYCLDVKGAKLLAFINGEDVAGTLRYLRSYAEVKGNFLRHTLEIIKFRLALEEAIGKNPEYSIFRWFNEYDIANPSAVKKRDKFYIYDEVVEPETGNRLSVYPDAAFVLDYQNSRKLYFLEIDMGTMTHRKIKDKVQAYNLYYKSNLFKARYGEEYSRFDVLFQTVSKARLENLRNSLKDKEGFELFRFLFAEEFFRLFK